MSRRASRLENRRDEALESAKGGRLILKLWDGQILDRKTKAADLSIGRSDVRVQDQIQDQSVVGLIQPLGLADTGDGNGRDLLPRKMSCSPPWVLKGQGALRYTSAYPMAAIGRLTITEPSRTTPMTR